MTIAVTEDLNNDGIKTKVKIAIEKSVSILKAGFYFYWLGYSDMTLKIIYLCNVKILYIDINFNCIFTFSATFVLKGLFEDNTFFKYFR